LGYVKANDVLPAEIIEQIQDYIEGETIYIPKRPDHKKCWGEDTDTKEVLAGRNHNIYNDYCHGLSVKALADKYFLAERSVKRIIMKET